MPNKPPRYQPPNPPRRAADTRPTAAARGYGARWQRFRLSFLAEHPLCVECDKEGRITEATVVDHRIPHKGNEAKFWEVSNLQALCVKCHNVKTSTTDGGFGRVVRHPPPAEGAAPTIATEG